MQDGAGGICHRIEIKSIDVNLKSLCIIVHIKWRSVPKEYICTITMIFPHLYYLSWAVSSTFISCSPRYKQLISTISIPQCLRHRILLLQATRMQRNQTNAPDAPNAPACPCCSGTCHSSTKIFENFKIIARNIPVTYDMT